MFSTIVGSDTFTFVLRLKYQVSGDGVGGTVGLMVALLARTSATVSNTKRRTLRIGVGHSEGGRWSSGSMCKDFGFVAWSVRSRGVFYTFCSLD